MVAANSRTIGKVQPGFPGIIQEGLSGSESYKYPHGEHLVVNYHDVVSHGGNVRSQHSFTYFNTGAYHSPRLENSLFTCNRNRIRGLVKDYLFFIYPTHNFW